MSPVLQWLLYSGSAVVIGTGIVAFFGPRLFEHWLNRRMEEFRVRLEAKYEGRLDAARHELQRAAEEHRVRFTRLHEQRAAVISGTYARLEDLNASVDAMMQFISTDLVEPPGRKEAVKAFQAFVKYYRRRSIWLPLETTELVGPILTLLRKPIGALALTRGRDINDLRRSIDDAHQILTKRVPEARAKLEENFRRLLEG